MQYMSRYHISYRCNQYGSTLVGDASLILPATIVKKREIEKYDSSFASSLIARQIYKSRVPRDNAHVRAQREMKKRVVIFGCTGNTGLCSLRTAVENGLEVRAFVRDETKIPEDLKSKVESVVGDVTNAKQVANAVAGRDAVVVVLGTGHDLSPTTVLSQGMKNIIDAMKAHNVELVSVCLSAFLFLKFEAVPAIFKELTADHQRMFDMIKSSGLKWVAILPPHIADTPKSKCTVTFDSSPGRVISKHDLGAFLVECLENSDYYQKVCGIANTS